MRNPYKGFRVWFNNFSTGWIGTVEWDGDRILIHDTDTIETIEKALKTLKAYATA